MQDSSYNLKPKSRAANQIIYILYDMENEHPLAHEGVVDQQSVLDMQDYRKIPVQN